MFSPITLSAIFQTSFRELSSIALPYIPALHHLLASLCRHESNNFTNAHKENRSGFSSQFTSIIYRNKFVVRWGNSLGKGTFRLLFESFKPQNWLYQNPQNLIKNKLLESLEDKFEGYFIFCREGTAFLLDKSDANVGILLLFDLRK